MTGKSGRGGGVRGRSLNATAASLLGFLHAGPMTGWDLVVAAEHAIGDFWSLTQSQVYRELATMAEQGLIRKGERGPRDKQPYELTEEGRAAFADWLDRPPSTETIRYPLLLTVLFGRSLPPDRLAGFVAEHRRVHAERLAGYERQRAELGPEMAELEPYAIATLDFGIAYEQAVVGWFDALPKAIRG